MVAAVTYDELSFWSGVATGCRLKGYTGYGTMPGWDPDGDLIVRPITQGIGRINFSHNSRFRIRSFTDILEPVFPECEAPAFLEPIERISLRPPRLFVLRPINERFMPDETIKSYSIDETINPLEYDKSLVYINSSGAFSLHTDFEEISRAVQIDNGSLELLSIDTTRFETVSSQEVTLC